MDEQLQRTVFERLQADDSFDQDWSVYVIAASSGPQELAAVLESPTPPSPLEVAEIAPEGEPLGAYLKSVTVQGFRGIGPEVALELTPGPGLTLVVGRNGSGKSSFAEGLEVLLSGDSRRWADPRPQVWKEGWRNLHHPHPSLVEAELLVEGQGEVRATRTWDADAPLDRSDVEVQPKGKSKTTLDYLNWRDALATYRPFLSYNELGSLLEGGPSKLFDALSVVLGLQDLVAAQKALREARLQRTKAMDAAKGEQQLLVARLQEFVDEEGDERASKCLDALSGKTWDLDTVSEQLQKTAGSASGSELTLLRQAAALQPVDSAALSDVASSLRDRAEALLGFEGTDAKQARHIASLLEQALLFHQSHGDSDCPVCGNTAALNESWRAASMEEIRRLKEKASGYDAVLASVDSVRQRALELLTAPPAFLAQLDGVAIDARALEGAWRAWKAGASIESLTELADHLEDSIEPFTSELNAVVKQAATELDRREDRWRPIAQDLMQWIDGARAAQEGMARVPGIKAAEKWLKDATGSIRSQRFAPIAEKAMSTWKHLRQQSNVELGRIELSGAGTGRKVTLDVTVDGVDGAALGVMSQGELHSLALSLFLPRATLAESPFRFVVIDDPVQSMDPARVDGLARALEETANTRQVIVFTHDERLPTAVRQLNIEATVIGVTRRTSSVVELRQASHPVKAYLDDAFTLVNSKQLPEDMMRHVVPGFCRSAIEAACHETVRRRRLGAGVPHGAVEKELEEARTLNQIAALALFDDVARAGDVMGRLNKWGGWAGDAFKRSKEGAHEGYSGDLYKLVKDVQGLCKRIVAA